MINVAIVEDDDGERARIEGFLTKYSDKFSVKKFSSAVDFLTNFVPVYDIVFMDIDMPYLDGMSAAKKMRKVDKETCLIFVTNLAKFAVKGYEVEAFDFIVKPVTYESFALKMNRVMNRLSLKQERYLMIRSGADVVKAAVGEIKYVEIMNHKIIYHMIDGEITSYGTLKDVEEFIADPLFVRSNKCYLINLRFVTGIEDGCAVVGGEKLLISSLKKSAFEKALADYLCGGAGR